MHVLNAYSFLWIPPIFGGIILLWKLKLNRQPRRVASLRLWQGLTDDKQANTPFHKLRASLLLFMQLLATFLLIFALSGPFLFAKAPPPRTIVFVIADSASMNATDAHGTRLDQAKQLCRNDINSVMRDYDSGCIVCVNRDVTVMAPFTNRKEALLEALDRIEPTDESPDIAGALVLSSAILTGHSGPSIHVYSDGVYSTSQRDKLSRVDISPATVTNTKVGSDSPANAGITAVEARTNPLTGHTDLNIGIAQCGGAVRQRSTVSVSVDGTLVGVQPILAQSFSKTFTSTLLDQGKVATITLDQASDVLSEDNTAVIPLPRSTPINVLLVSTGNIYLERALAVDKTVQVSEITPAQFLSQKSTIGNYNVVVLDSYIPAIPLPPGRYVAINATSAQFPLSFGKSSESVADPQFVDQDDQSPVMRSVAFDSGILIQRAPKVTLAPWAASLADWDCGPLIAVGNHHNIRSVQIAWDLNQSNWPLRVSFPIFLNNALKWLTSNHGENGGSLGIAAGDPVDFDLAAGSSNLVIHRPDGEPAVLTVPAEGGTVTYQDTNLVGTYNAAATGFQAAVYVNLLDRDSTLLTPLDLPTIKEGAPEGAGGGGVISIRESIAVWIAAVGLLCIALEWFVFHRRP